MLVRLEGVRVDIRTGSSEAPVLRGVTLDVARGEYVALLGPSGAGKSTLLFVLAGLVRPSVGICRLDATNLDALGDEELARLRGRRIGMVFGAFHLVPHLSALENVEVALVYQRLAPAPRRARAAEALAELGMAAHLRSLPHELSGVERARVAIARACVAEPALLLADEPTAELDGRGGDEVMELLEARHARGTALVVATHDAARARRARRLIQMRDGVLLRELAGLRQIGARAAPLRRLRGRARRR